MTIMSVVEHKESVCETFTFYFLVKVLNVQSISGGGVVGFEKEDSLTGGFL